MALLLIYGLPFAFFFSDQLILRGRSIWHRIVGIVILVGAFLILVPALPQITEILAQAHDLSDKIGGFVFLCVVAGAAYGLGDLVAQWGTEK